MEFNKRKFLNFNKGNSHIAFEISGFKNHPSIFFNVNGDEGEFTFHIGFGIGLYITFNGMWPKKWYPSYESDNFGQLPSSRRIGISFHDWHLWWDLWIKNDTTFYNYPRWRDGNFDFEWLLKGTHKVRFDLMEENNFIISFLEGNYQIRVQKKKRYDQYSRAKTKIMYCFDVKAGMIYKGKWIDVPIPKMGRGSASHNQGQDGTWSMYFPAKTKTRNLQTPYEAALYFEYQMKLDRMKTSHSGWVPEKHKHERIVILK